MCRCGYAEYHPCIFVVSYYSDFGPSLLWYSYPPPCYAPAVWSLKFEFNTVWYLNIKTSSDSSVENLTNDVFSQTWESLEGICSLIILVTLLMASRVRPQAMTKLINHYRYNAGRLQILTCATRQTLKQITSRNRSSYLRSCNAWHHFKNPSVYLRS
jgi:hypothetical protein